jgi:hypothetical protein
VEELAAGDDRSDVVEAIAEATAPMKKSSAFNDNGEGVLERKKRWGTCMFCPSRGP